MSSDVQFSICSNFLVNSSRIFLISGLDLILAFAFSSIGKDGLVTGANRFDISDKQLIRFLARSISWSGVSLENFFAYLRKSESSSLEIYCEFSHFAFSKSNFELLLFKWSKSKSSMIYSISRISLSSLDDHPSNAR